MSLKYLKLPKVVCVRVTADVIKWFVGFLGHICQVKESLSKTPKELIPTVFTNA